MFYHQVFAQINNSIVQNIIVCRDYNTANVLSKNLYGKDAIAVECTYWDCSIADKYENGKFYSPDNVERQYKGTEVENINSLQQQVSEDNDTILDLMYENDLLKDQVEEDNDSLLDLDYRVSQLEDKEEA